MCLTGQKERLHKQRTHHKTTSNDSSQVFHLLTYMSILGIFDISAREEQHDVTDDGNNHQWVKSDGDASGAFPSTHVDQSEEQWRERLFKPTAEERSDGVSANCHVSVHHMISKPLKTASHVGPPAKDENRAAH